MKINKLITAGVLCLGTLGVSNAATVYMTGSTADRANVQASLLSPASGVFASTPAYTVWDGGSTGNNAGNGGNWMTFSGTANATNGGGALVVKCHWSGSEAGVKDVVNSGLSEDFLSDAQSDGADHGTNQPGPGFDHSLVDLAMADAAQSFSQSSVLKGFSNIASNKEVSIIPFTFVRNNGLWTGTNITSSMFIQAQGLGCARAVFTGNAADINDFMYISGRDSGSGTRVNVFGDTGYGISTPANQIEINSSGVMQQVNGTFFGEIGYSSGGTLAKTMGANTTTSDDQALGLPGNGFSVIAYLSRGDANTALALTPTPAVELSYNGVVQSRANVIEGTHTLWGNEFIFARNGAGGLAIGVYKALAFGGINATISPTATTAIRLQDMHCTRSGPTSVPSHN
jgi:hypothetical protein